MWVQPLQNRQYTPLRADAMPFVASEGKLAWLKQATQGGAVTGASTASIAEALSWAGLPEASAPTEHTRVARSRAGCGSFLQVGVVPKEPVVGSSTRNAARVLQEQAARTRHCYVSWGKEENDAKTHMGCFARLEQSVTAKKACDGSPCLWFDGMPAVDQKVSGLSLEQDNSDSASEDTQDTYDHDLLTRNFEELLDRIDGERAEATESPATDEQLPQKRRPRRRGLRNAQSRRERQVRRFDVDRDPDEQTTVMIKNIACRYSEEQVTEFLDDVGLKGKYRWVYVPMNSRKCANLGYLFVDLLESEFIEELKTALNGRVFGYRDSTKVCEVSMANVQGLRTPGRKRPGKNIEKPRVVGPPEEEALADGFSGGAEQTAVVVAGHSLSCSSAVDNSELVRAIL